MRRFKDMAFLLSGFLFLFSACQETAESSETAEQPATKVESPPPPGALSFTLEAEDNKSMNGAFTTVDIGQDKVIRSDSTNGWLAFEVDVPVSGRYRCEVRLSSAQTDPGHVWMEDYYNNDDGRTYNITSSMKVPATGDAGSFQTIYKDGSPLGSGIHRMKFHVEGAGIHVDWIKFILIRENQPTPQTLVQQTEGTDWQLVWSDEFEGEGLPDSTKWTYDIGNWGWGNSEPQYYTARRPENARLENGNLIIEARKNDGGYDWTSARLTTRGKIRFIYGKVEFRAKVPAADGTWAAGWFLGDAYRDELSWPYCGEIDVLECVGNEIDDETGNGINHASCHTRAYYFKQNNHLTATIEVEDMVDEYHTYAIEWLPTGIKAFLDGEHYYTYDKTKDKLEWPFSNPQNIILNLAMGGGMGGEIGPEVESARLTVDYVRIYELADNSGE